MFTQCSNCNTVFQLSAEVLRAAGGQVRCGRCGEIFSALARLAEHANAFDTGESAYDMEERADSILESVVAEQVAQAVPDIPDEGDFDGSQIAQLQVIDFTEEDLLDEAPEENSGGGRDVYPDAALEFTLPPGELDRIFIESRGTGLPPFPPAHTAPMSAAVETVPAPGTVPAGPGPLAEDDGPLPDIEVIRDNRSQDALRRPLSPLEQPAPYELLQPPPRRVLPFTLWILAAILSALLLAGQVVNRNREALTAQGPLAPALRLLYSSIGAPLDGTLNLGAFQLRQWGVTGDPAADGTLRVRASILNTSAQLQPFPLLRLTLANRYGTRIGARDFEPGEYMGKPIARMLSPGETVDAILNILDPGKEAEGFEIDVCLRGADKKIICANDLSQAKS